MSKLRVYVVEVIGGHGGMLLYDLASFKSLAQKPVEVTWVTCDETQAVPEGYEIWKPFVRIYGTDPKWLRATRYLKGLVSVLYRARKAKAQGRIVVHFHFVTVPFLELLFYVSLRFMSISSVLSPHDVRPYRKMATWLLPMIYRQCNALIVHSISAKNELVQMLGERTPPIHYIPHGHYNDSHGGGARLGKAEARRSLGLPQERPLILFLGLMRKEKGVEFLIKAMPAVLEKLPGALLVLAGRPFHNDIRSYIDLIHALGISSSVITRWEYVPENELSNYYRASNVVAIPYTRAFQSGVCLTAYAFRRPVVASDIGGLSEQVQNGKTGLLVPPKDPLAIAQALTKILTDASLARRMGYAGHSWAEKNCSWTDVATKTYDLYCQVSSESEDSIRAL